MRQPMFGSVDTGNLYRTPKVHRNTENKTCALDIGYSAYNPDSICRQMSYPQRCNSRTRRGRPEPAARRSLGYSLIASAVACALAWSLFVLCAIGHSRAGKRPCTGQLFRRYDTFPKVRITE